MTRRDDTASSGREEGGRARTRTRTRRGRRGQRAGLRESETGHGGIPSANARPCGATAGCGRVTCEAASGHVPSASVVAASVGRGPARRLHEDFRVRHVRRRGGARAFHSGGFSVSVVRRGCWRNNGRQAGARSGAPQRGRESPRGKTERVRTGGGVLETGCDDPAGPVRPQRRGGTERCAHVPEGRVPTGARSSRWIASLPEEAKTSRAQELLCFCYGFLR